jgi:hypothetical protein
VLPGAPAEFYGVLGARVAAFDSATGRRLRWLTSPRRGLADDRPAVVTGGAGTYVAFVRAGTGQGCGGTVLRVPAAGGREETLLDLGDAYVTGFGIDRAGTTLAYSFTRCRGDDSHTYLRVVDVATRRTVVDAWSSFEGNGFIGVCCFAVHRRRVVLHAGIHDTSWLAVLDVRPSRRRVDIDALPQVPFEDGCRPSAPLWSRGAIVTVAWCSLAGGDEQRLLRFAPPFRRPERGRLAARLPVSYDLTGSDGEGRLVGTRTSDAFDDDPTTYVVQLDGTRERLLGACPSRDSKADACVRLPVW